MKHDLKCISDQSHCWQTDLVTDSPCPTLFMCFSKAEIWVSLLIESYRPINHIPTLSSISIFILFLKHLFYFYLFFLIYDALPTFIKILYAFIEMFIYWYCQVDDLLWLVSRVAPRGLCQQLRGRCWCPAEERRRVCLSLVLRPPRQL